MSSKKAGLAESAVELKPMDKGKEKRGESSRGIFDNEGASVPFQVFLPGKKKDNRSSLNLKLTAKNLLKGAFTHKDAANVASRNWGRRASSGSSGGNSDGDLNTSPSPRKQRFKSAVLQVQKQNAVVKSLRPEGKKPASPVAGSMRKFRKKRFKSAVVKVAMQNAVIRTMNSNNIPSSEEVWDVNSGSDLFKEKEKKKTIQPRRSGSGSSKDGKGSKRRKTAMRKSTYQVINIRDAEAVTVYRKTITRTLYLGTRPAKYEIALLLRPSLDSELPNRQTIPPEHGEIISALDAQKLRSTHARIRVGNAMKTLVLVGCSHERLAAQAKKEMEDRWASGELVHRTEEMDRTSFTPAERVYFIYHAIRAASRRSTPVPSNASRSEEELFDKKFGFSPDMGRGEEEKVSVLEEYAVEQAFAMHHPKCALEFLTGVLSSKRRLPDASRFGNSRMSTLFSWIPAGNARAQSIKIIGGLSGYEEGNHFMGRDQIGMICEYFGREEGFYFGFLNHYTKSICWLAFIGLVVFVLRAVLEDQFASRLILFAWTITVMLWSNSLMFAWDRKKAAYELEWGVSLPKLNLEQETALVWLHRLRPFAAYIVLLGILFIIVGLMMHWDINMRFDDTKGCSTTSFDGVDCHESAENPAFDQSMLRVLPPLVFAVCCEIASRLCREALRGVPREALDRPRVVVFGIAFAQLLGGLGIGIILALFWVPKFSETDLVECPPASSVSAFDIFCLKETTPYALRTNLMENYVTWPFIFHLITRIVISANRARHDVFPDMTCTDGEAGPALVTRIILESENTESTNEDEFLEIYIHFLWVTMFSVISPLMPLLSLIGAMVETRCVPHKLVRWRKRPIPRRANAIKSWARVFEVTCKLAGMISIAVFAISLSFMDIFLSSHAPGKPLSTFWKEALIAILLTEQIVQIIVWELAPTFKKIKDRL